LIKFGGGGASSLHALGSGEQHHAAARSSSSLGVSGLQVGGVAAALQTGAKFIPPPYAEFTNL
jgi:hypothetical protein